MLAYQIVRLNVTILSQMVRIVMVAQMGQVYHLQRIQRDTIFISKISNFMKMRPLEQQD